VRPAVRYYGGKFRLAPWIISFFPPHEHYIEPFGGAASVLLRKPRSLCETYNDRYGEIVTFFRVLRDRTEQLLRAIALTPYAYDEYQLSLEPWPEDELEQARLFYIKSQQGFGGASTQWRTGWRRWLTKAGSNTPSSVSWTNTEHLYEIAERLQGVQIENDDALNIIERYDSCESLFYVDPPYPRSTRSERWCGKGYQHELSDEDHEQLSALLHEIEGMAIISGYPCKLYDKLYWDWHQETTDALAEGGNRTTEALWINPLAYERWQQMPASIKQPQLGV
jgi:DNA adenine methylase